VSGARLGVALLASCLAACGSSCPRESEDTARRYEKGRTSSDRAFYETNAWDEYFVDFPAGRRWALVHGLSETPIELRSYLAFKKDPLPKGGKGFVAESAGNQVLIEGVDEDSIRVRNDTCEHFWLRLVASTVPSQDGSGGAGGSP
jgi:hypothetical protein